MPTMHRPTAPARSGRVRAALYALAWLLAFTQTLGLVHGVLHAPRAEPAGANAATAAPAFSAFGHDGHAGAACQLYDQLSHGDAAPSVAPLLPAFVPPVAIAPAEQPSARAADAAPFCARAPPSFA